MQKKAEHTAAFYDIDLMRYLFYAKIHKKKKAINDVITQDQ